MHRVWGAKTDILLVMDNAQNIRNLEKKETGRMQRELKKLKCSIIQSSSQNRKENIIGGRNEAC